MTASDPAEASIRLSRAHFPVTVLGRGRRIGLWLQGCSIGCRFCMSTDTWHHEGGVMLPVDQVAAWCRAQAADGIDGITITGGEPFEQAPALRVLLERLRAWLARDHPAADILCYSGMRLHRLKARHGAILALLDAIIPEPFRHDRPPGATWQGSDNQPLVALSDLGRERYGPYLDGTLPIERSLQFAVHDERLWLIGIPERGHLRRLGETLREQGLEVDGLSWSP
jgi:anaerobic ribonucleoside-triphosphate reductase activating protein